MIILHTIWIPATMPDFSAPKILIWAEDVVKFNILMYTHKKYLSNSHPYALNHDNVLDILEHLSSHNSWKEWIQMNSTVTKASHQIQLKNISTTERGSLPVLAEYQVNSSFARHEQYEVIFSQIDQRLSSNTSAVLNEYSIDAIEFDLENFMYLIQMIDYDTQTKEISMINGKQVIIAEDFEYLFQLSVWLKSMINSQLVVPKLLSRREWISRFSGPWESQLPLSDDQGSAIMGWWELYQDDVILQQITAIQNLLPSSLHPVTPAEDLSTWNTALLNDILTWSLNLMIRNEEGTSTGFNNISTISLNEQPEQFFNQAKQALFTSDIFFTSLSSPEIDWFVKKFNNWVEEEKTTQSSNWQVSLLLIMPNGEVTEQWYLSYVLQHKAEHGLMISPDQIWDQDAELLYFKNKKESIKLIKLLLDQLIEDIPSLSSYIPSQVKPYFDIKFEHIPEFLSTIPPIMEQKGYTLYLPKNLKTKFVHRNQVRLELDISTDSHLNFRDYSLVMMLGDQEVSIEEILQMASHKAGLVKIHDKWVYLDRDEIESVKALLERKLTSPSTLDLLRIEMEGLPDLNEQGFQTFNPNLITSSKLSRTLSEGYTQLKSIRGLKTSLRPYQKSGVSWLITLANWGLGGILADDMGLGKTVQTISSLLHLKNKKNSRCTLIIAPTSVIGNWLDELRRFAPSLQAILHHGSKRIGSKGQLKKEFRKTDVVVTTYSIARRDNELLGSYEWNGIILDEAQYIKNAKTKTHKNIVSLSSKFRFALTGTPIENKLEDLWALFNFITPGYLGNQSQFKSEFITPIAKGEQRRLDLLRTLIAPFILRRYKTDQSIIKDLPDKMEKKVFTTMTIEQIALYQAITTSAVNNLEKMKGIQKQGVILSTMTRLKQVCNHPANYLRDENIKIKRSGKFRALVDLLDTIIGNNEKVIIFSQFRVMCDLIEKLIRKHYNLPVFQLHGGTRLDQRISDIDCFSKIIGSSAYIISLKAGGTGLNLHAANHVIHFDRWWNPAVENQATDRAYRIGQKKDVMIYKFVSPGTLEEQIDNLLEQKSQLSKEVVGGLQGDITSMSVAEFRELIKLRNVLEY